MTSSRKSKKRRKIPFRLKSVIEYYHQYFFLQYINEIAPEVATSIKNLSLPCEELFGKIPAVITDFEKDVWFPIHNIVKDCLWKETRNIGGAVIWLDYLKKYSQKFKPIFKKDSKHEKNCQNYVDKEIKERFDYWRSYYSEKFEITQDEITKDQLDFWLYENRCDYLNNNDENYRKMQCDKMSALGELIEFQKDFDSLIEKFCLEKQWLVNIVFRAVWDGTGQLQMYQKLTESFDENLISDVRKKLGRKNQNSFSTEKYHLPLPSPFVYTDSYWIYFPFEDYEKAAVEAYRKHLSDYYKILKETFREYGYVGTKGKKYDYNRVKWLVWRNIKHFSKEQILVELEIDSEARGDIKYYAVSSIEKAFQQFKTYNLPVRD